MQSSSYFCDACGRNLDEAKDLPPIVAQVHFGLTPIGQARHPEGYDFAKVAMPESVRTVLNLPVAQMHLCLQCFAPVVEALGKGPMQTAEGKRAALPVSRQRSATAFVEDGFVSVRPEHPNRAIREQRRKAEAGALAKQQAAEAPEQRRARLKAELAALDAEDRAKTAAERKRARRALQRAEPAP